MRHPEDLVFKATQDALTEEAAVAVSGGQEPVCRES